MSSTGKLTISIRMLTGKTYKIKNAQPGWTVKQLKTEFEKWTEHGSSCMLFYRAKRLQDGNTLESYKIESESVIQANIRSTGGERTGSPSMLPLDSS